MSDAHNLETLGGALAALSRWLDEEGLQGAVIGDVGASLVGRPRLTPIPHHRPERLRRRRASLRVRVASPEDLVIMKALARRPRMGGLEEWDGLQAWNRRPDGGGI